MSDFRVSPVEVDSLARLLSRLLRFEGPADATIFGYLSLRLAMILASSGW